MKTIFLYLGLFGIKSLERSTLNFELLQADKNLKGSYIRIILRQIDMYFNEL